MEEECGDDEVEVKEVTSGCDSKMDPVPRLSDTKNCSYRRNNRLVDYLKARGYLIQPNPNQ